MSLHGFAFARCAIFGGVNTLFPPLFSATELEDQRLTPAALSSFIQGCQREYQTGMIEFFPRAGGPSHLLLLAGGQIVASYLRCNPALRLAPDSWPRALAEAEGWIVIRSLTLTPQALRLLKILVECPEAEPASLHKTNQIEEVIAEKGGEPAPSLLHLAWSGAEGLILLAGGGRPPRQSLFLSAGQIVHSAGGVSALCGWREPEYRLRLLPWRENCPAWEEYLLHRAFVGLTEHLLRRFGEIDGQAALNLLLEEMNYTQAAQGWPLRFAASGVTDQVIASSPRQAADICSRVWHHLYPKMETALGPAAFSLLRREAQSRLSVETRQTLRKYGLLLDHQSGRLGKRSLVIQAAQQE